MGITGPIPKRSDERVRRNLPDVPVTKLPVVGQVETPELKIDYELPTHPLVADLYESLTTSAQNKFYEPSDWQYARLTMHLLNEMLWSTNRSAVMVASINQMLTSLLMTEGDRRRVRLEVERNPDEGEGGKVLQVADLFRRQLKNQGLGEG